jgi:hypothetical protein
VISGRARISMHGDDKGMHEASLAGTGVRMKCLLHQGMEIIGSVGMSQWQNGVSLLKRAGLVRHLRH